MAAFKKSHKLLIFSLIALVFLGSLSAHKMRAPKRNYSDFHCYYLAGRRILNQENIYRLRDQEAAEFRYAPVFALIISPLTLMNEGNADTAWFILNFFLLLTSFVLIRKMVAPHKLKPKAEFALYLLTILGVMRFIFHNFDTGQSNILILSSMVAGLYYVSKEREVEGGALLAFSAMIKYTPLVFIPYFILRKKFKLSLSIIGFMAVYLMLPALAVGFKTNTAYLNNLLPFLTKSTIFDSMTILDPKNQSLFSFISRLFTNCIAYFHAPRMPFQNLNLNQAAINAIFVFSAISLYLFALYKPKKAGLPEKNFSAYPDYALLFICIATFNLNAWVHNYILLTMGYFIISQHLIRSAFKDKPVLALWLLSFLVNILTIKPLLGKTLNYKLYFYSPFTIIGLLIFAALLKIKFCAPDEE